jgi:hypothetical protein
VKEAAMLLGARGGRRGTGGPDWAEKVAGPNWDAEPTGFFGLKWEREKKKTGCKIEFRIYSKIRDLNIFKPNLN